MNEPKENQENSDSNDENTEVEETTENNAEQGDSDNTDLKSAIAQKKRYREKFNKSDEVMTKLFGEDWEGRVDEIDLDEKPKQQKSSSDEKDLSQRDLIAIIKNDVHEDDISEVKDYAKLKDISVSEALESTTVKTILSEKQEHRKTAEATHTGKTKSKGSKVSDSELLRKAEKGEFPEPGTSEAKRLYELRRENK